MVETAIPKNWADRITGLTREEPAQLLAQPLNPKRHGAVQRTALRAALDSLGWIAAVTVNDATGYVLDGHARIEEALSRGEATVPVIHVTLSPEEEALALLTLDPIGAMFEVERENMDALLRQVETDSAELGRFLAEQAEREGLTFGGQAEPPADPGADLDRAAELQTKWGTGRGQLWQIGRHRLLCGDSTDAADVARLMDGARAGMVLTDPPYGMRLDTDWSDLRGSLKSIGRANQTSGRKYDPVIGDDVNFDPTPIFTSFGYCSEMFLWGADYYAESIPDRIAGSWLVWDKRTESQADAIGAEFELCWSKSRHKRRVLRHDWFGFLSSGNARDARSRQHPTQKPVTLMADIMRQWSSASDIVVDGFLGSGSTMVAAEQLDRICYGMEIEPKYCAVILERMAGMGLVPALVPA